MIGKAELGSAKTAYSPKKQGDPGKEINIDGIGRLGKCPTVNFKTTQSMEGEESYKLISFEGRKGYKVFLVLFGEVWNM